MKRLPASATIVQDRGRQFVIGAPFRMPLGDFQAAGTIPRPLAIGRAGRLLFGIGTGFYFAWNITQRSDWVSLGVLDGGGWVGVGFAFWYSADMVVVGLTRNWGRWPQAAVIVIALALLGAGAAVYGDAWTPPLAWFLFIFAELFFGTLAVSFLLGSMLAVPG